MPDNISPEAAQEIQKIMQLSPQQAQNRLQAEMCRRDLKYFIKTFWDTINDVELEWNWHLDIICEELTRIAHRVGNKQKKEYDLVINVPPGTTKTTTVSIMFPVWCWTNWAWMKFITAAHGTRLSLESSEYSRDVVRSDKFKRLFPELEIKRDKDQKSNFKIQEHVMTSTGRYHSTRDKGNRISTSVGSGIIGFHGDILIIDDPIDPEGVLHESAIEKANHWMDHTIPMRKTDKRYSTTIMIMQRLAENDPTGHVLERRGDEIKHICLPGEIRTEKYKENVKPPELVKYYKDGLLDPNRMPMDVLETMRSTELGQLGYAGQIGQAPTPPGGDLFKVDNFIKIPNMVDPRKISRIIRYWDKAGTSRREAKKKGRKPAYTAGVKMAKLKTGRYVVMDVVRGQWAADMREKVIKQTARNDGVKVKIWLEQEPGSGGKDSAEATIRNLAGYVCKAERPTGNKVYRADPYSVQVNNGNVMVLDKDWTYDFIEEHRHFPHGRYKDQVDAAAAAFNKLAKDRRAGPIT